MPNIVSVTVHFDDNSTQTVAVPAGAPRPDFHVHAEHAKAAMDQYRYFGNLRAMVTWFPIVIVLTGVEYTRQTAGGFRTPLFVALGFLAIGLLLVWLAQRGFQKRQAWAVEVANTAERRYLAGEDPTEGYQALYERTKRDRGRVAWDPPSRALAILFVLLVGTYAASIFGLGPIVEERLWPTPVAEETQTGDPSGQGPGTEAKPDQDKPQTPAP